MTVDQADEVPFEIACTHGHNSIVAKLRAQLKRGDEFKEEDSFAHSTLFLLRYVDHDDLIHDLGLVRRVQSQRKLSTTSKEDWL